MPASVSLPASARPFVIAGYPCSGADWCARLLAMHPHIAVVDAADPLGPLGDGNCTLGTEVPPPADLAERVQRALAEKPAAQRVGVVALTGTRAGFDADRIVVVRDGRDVLIHWTLRQLRAKGPVLQGFLGKVDPDNRMPDLARRFAIDPADVLERNRGLLLADYGWVRFGTYLWAEAIDGHFGALAWANDHPSDERDPRTVHFDVARTEVRATFDDLCCWLGLDPTLVPPFATPDPVQAAEPDPLRRSEWEVGVWPGFFTERATRLFKMEGEAGLDALAGHTIDDDWQGKCRPA
jgi:hypothetical protein